MSHSPLAQRIAADIATKISMGDIALGDHLATEGLAREFEVSRSPVREALELLAAQGVIESRRNRGYFVCMLPSNDTDGSSITSHIGGNDAYSLFAEDWLNDRIEADLTEQSLRERYSLTKSQSQDMLMRAVRDGWADAKPGYGWKLRPVAKTAEAFEQIYRFRAIIEPAALLEPGFRLDRIVVRTLRRTQERLAAGQIAGMPAEMLSAAGFRFHEDLIRMSGNPMFLQALERANQLRRLVEFRLKVNPQRIIAQSTEHLEILDLLERGETLDAAHLMRRHLSGALATKSPVIHPKAD